MQEEKVIEACGCGSMIFGLTALGFLVTASYYQLTFTQEKPEEKKMMTYLGSATVAQKTVLFFDTDGDLKTAEKVYLAKAGELPNPVPLKVGERFSFKDVDKIAAVQQKTRE